MLLAQNMCLHYIKTVLEVCMQCLRTEGPFNTFQMQDSPSVVLRGTRLLSKPEDLSLQSPCSSQNAMKMEHLPRSVSNHPRLFPSLLNLSRFIFLFPLVSCVLPLFRSPQNWAFSSLTEKSTPCSLFTLSCVLPLPCVLPLQVQCHTLTGYCWCVTSDGKPVSGSSVHNRTPVCSGTK